MTGGKAPPSAGQPDGTVGTTRREGPKRGEEGPAKNRIKNEKIFAFRYAPITIPVPQGAQIRRQIHHAVVVFIDSPFNISIINPLFFCAPF